MQYQPVVNFTQVIMYHWIFCEKIPGHKLEAVRDPSNPPHVMGLFYDKSMNETTHLDKACEEWEPLLVEVIKMAVEPSRKSPQDGLNRLNSTYDKKLFHPDPNHDNSSRLQAQGIKMMISRISDKKRTFVALCLHVGVGLDKQSIVRRHLLWSPPEPARQHPEAWKTGWHSTE